MRVTNPKELTSLQSEWPRFRCRGEKGLGQRLRALAESRALFWLLRRAPLTGKCDTSPPEMAEQFGWWRKVRQPISDFPAAGRSGLLQLHFACTVAPQASWEAKLDTGMAQGIDRRIYDLDR
jgi:hypothetical protein